MLKVNEYFEGKVKSISFEDSVSKATAGVMDIGEFEFGTSSKEVMTVSAGCLNVKLPGQDVWHDFKTGESFTVEANQKFYLKVNEQSAYICRFY